jgi:hypothetical protein
MFGRDMAYSCDSPGLEAVSLMSLKFEGSHTSISANHGAIVKAIWSFTEIWRLLRMDSRYGQTLRTLSLVAGAGVSDKMKEPRN